MREAKFHAWDKVNHCWSHDFLYIDEDGDLYEIEERSQSYETYMYKKRVSDRYIVVWYTGLHDKNGREIYGEDIVQYKSQSLLDSISGKPMEVRTSIIRWFDDELMFALYQPETNKWTTNLTLSADDGHFEVIGNTYENPDLLKQ